METMKMKTVQLYITQDLHGILIKTFGHGKMSANVERIIRAHLQDAGQEKKLQLQELNKQIRLYNSEWAENAELMFPEKVQ